MPARASRPSKMDRWAPVVDQWLEDDRKERRKQRSTAYRVWARLTEEMGGRGLRGHRAQVRPQQAARDEVRARRVPRPRLSPRHGAGGLRRGRLPREGHQGGHELLRAELPVLQRRSRAGLPGRERRVRVPGPAQHIRAPVGGAHVHRLRQRGQRRQAGMRRRAHHRALRGLRRPLRLRLQLLQPRLRKREGQRGEQGRGAQALPPRADLHVRQRRQLQLAHPGRGARALEEGTLP